MFGLAWGVGYQILLAYEKELHLTTTKIIFLLFSMFVSSWIGAKLFFLFTLPEDYRNDLATESSFWMGGGLVFLGGLIFGLIAFLIWKKMSGFSFKYGFPLLLALIWGHAIGRVGCLLAGCCYGNATTLPWGIHLHGENRHPTQAYEIILLVCTAIFLNRDYKKYQDVIRSLFIYFIFYGVGRFLIEIFRGDEIRGQWGFFTPSQWVGIIMAATGVVGLLYKHRQHNHSK